MQENMLDRLNLSSLNYTYFPSPFSVLKLHIRFTLSLASQDLPSTSYDINHTTWALSMQGNIAKGDSDQIFYLQINSLAHLLPPSLSLLQSFGNWPWVKWQASLLAVSCWLTEVPRGLVLKVCVKALSGVTDYLYDLTPVICLACPSVKPVKRIGSIEEKQELLKNVLAHWS